MRDEVSVTFNIHPRIIAAAYIVLNPEYSKPTHRFARTKVFIALGLCSILPVSNLVLFHGIYTVLREMGCLWLLAAGVMYITGAVLLQVYFPYSLRLPSTLTLIVTRQRL